jgi:AcrR family transcriptional regulator
LTKEELVQRFRRREILKAARAIFVEYGFEDTTMERIAERAGISKGTIYIYFKNKSDLLIQAVAEVLDAVYKMGEGILAKEMLPLNKIKLWISEVMNYFEQNRSFFRILQNIRGEFYIEKVEEKIKELHRPIEIYALAGRILEDGIRQGKLIDASPVRIGAILVKMVEGILICRINEERETPISDDVELAYQAFINGVGRKEM